MATAASTSSTRTQVKSSQVNWNAGALVRERHVLSTLSSSSQPNDVAHAYVNLKKITEYAYKMLWFLLVLSVSKRRTALNDP